MMAQSATAAMASVDTDWEQVGNQIASCVRERDFDRLARYFHPQVACRLLIPPGLLTPHDVSTLISKYRQWFGVADHFNMETSQVTRVGEHLHVGYRIRLREEGLWYVVEQQTYSQLEGGTISHFDLLCSGFCLDDQPR